MCAQNRSNNLEGRGFQFRGVIGAAFNVPRNLLGATKRLLSAASGKAMNLGLSGEVKRVETDNWPISEYERGLGGEYLFLPRRRYGGNNRYCSAPSFTRLMLDLKRPAASRDAREVLLARISDPVTLEWVSNQIASGDLYKLAMWVRPWMSERDVLEAWRMAAVAEAATLNEELSDCGQSDGWVEPLGALTEENLPTFGLKR